MKLIQGNEIGGGKDQLFSDPDDNDFDFNSVNKNKNLTPTETVGKDGYQTFRHHSQEKKKQFKHFQIKHAVSAK